ncbi:C2H2-type zinc finger protein [Halapricum hydrolyticum]|uniref:C2H2-type zinc finger protein n=1 Tax=Halapricum hydrolyticum TaxID=2979991 RepID=A0AAE3I8P0_9EURY|nr:C2H2-type zinc finger protein [Halapricum hydrolyticum]MCU4716622.1 C2H2-type zinc finger protein [Halapricum hydrolyticum]MCU4725773.1 C2H2-type zinc finger protein [Halapricum hydrolyticum]
MSPEISRSGSGEEDRDDLPRWWGETDEFDIVVLTDRKLQHGGNHPAAPEEAAAEDMIRYRRGEALPDELKKPSTWRAFSDTLAAVDPDSGERLDRRSIHERQGVIDATPALDTYREDHDLHFERREVWTCEECGKKFPTQAALHGHRGSHGASRDENGEYDGKADADESDEDAAQAAAGEDAGEIPFTTEAVEDADEAALRELARVHTDLDPDGFGADRLRAELLARVEDAGTAGDAGTVDEADEATATDGGEP